MGGEKSQSVPPVGADEAAFDTAQEARQEAFKDLWDKHISKSTLSEVAINDAAKMRQEAIGKIFQKYREQYREEIQRGATDRQSLAQKMAEQADQAALAFQENFENVLTSAHFKESFGEQELLYMKRLLIGMETLALQDKTVNPILQKLAAQKSLLPADYQQVVKLLQPFELESLTKANADPKKSFEATGAGMIIRLMNKSQRQKLLETLAESDKKDQMGEMLDGFLRAGLLEDRQAQELLQSPKVKAVIQPDKMAQFEEHLGTGFYQKEADKMVEEIKKAADSLHDQMLDVNPMLRMTGMPGLGMLGMLYGILLTLSNLLANGGKLGPYGVGGIAIAAGGLEVATGSMKHGTSDWGIGAGVISKGIHWLTEDSRPMKEPQERAMNFLSSIYMRYLGMGDYLRRGGVETILDIHKKKAEEKSKNPNFDTAITMEDLKKANTPDQQAYLNQAVRRTSAETVLAQVNLMPETLRTLGIDESNPQKFDDLVKQIREHHGLN